jgi:hypothetical protein
MNADYLKVLVAFFRLKEWDSTLLPNDIQMNGATPMQLH